VIVIDCASSVCSIMRRVWSSENPQLSNQPRKSCSVISFIGSPVAVFPLNTLYLHLTMVNFSPDIV
jgi:hypothetical protein